MQKLCRTLSDERAAELCLPKRPRGAVPFVECGKGDGCYSDMSLFRATRSILSFALCGSCSMVMSLWGSI